MKKIVDILHIIITLSLGVSCGVQTNHGSENFKTSIYIPEYASGFVIDTDGEGNNLIRVTQPWQGSDVEEQTLAIFATEEAAEGYVGEYIVGAADRVVCMSTSHIAMLPITTMARNAECLVDTTVFLTAV